MFIDLGLNRDDAIHHARTFSAKLGYFRSSTYLRNLAASFYSPSGKVILKALPGFGPLQTLDSPGRFSIRGVWISTIHKS